MSHFPLTAADAFILAASDGLWDVVTDEKAVELAQVRPQVLLQVSQHILHENVDKQMIRIARWSFVQTNAHEASDDLPHTLQIKSAQAQQRCFA